MKFSFIKTAAISPQVFLANPHANACEIIKYIDLAKKEHCEILVFPEMCMTGYTCGELFLHETLLNSCLNQILHLKEYSKNFDGIIFVGAPIVFQQKLYSCAIALNRGQILGIVPKVNLPNYSEFYEARYFTSGKNINSTLDIDGTSVPFSDKLLFKAGGICIGIEICEDMFVPSPPSNAHAEAGANIIVNLSASNELISKSDYRKTLISAQSGRLSAAYIYASAGRGESVSDTVYGAERIIAENGEILAAGSLFEPGMAVSEIDIGRLDFCRRKLNVFSTNSLAYKVIPFSIESSEIKLTRKFSKTPFVPNSKDSLHKRAEDILRIQSFGLSQKLETTKLKAVLGISGGLDSTLALLVVLRAYEILNKDKKDIIAITMPGPGTSAKTLKNISLLEKCLGISIPSIPIGAALDVHLKDINHAGGFDTAYENAQARERTQILMDTANARGGMVIGTGDLSEIALGWATYNGDHMSMYGINSGIPKTLVKHLVAYEGDRRPAYSEALEAILSTDISPELLPAKDGKITQKTEQIIGPYILHDFFLYYTLRFGYDPKKMLWLADYVFSGDHSLDELKKWLSLFLKRFFANQFKRNCMPDGLKVGTVSLSPRADWRMPSEAEVNEWLDF